DGALAVRAGDGDDGTVRSVEPERTRHAPDACETEVDAPRMHRLLQLEPVVELAHGSAALRPRRWSWPRQAEPAAASSGCAARTTRDPACPAGRRSCRAHRARAGTRCAGSLRAASRARFAE